MKDRLKETLLGDATLLITAFVWGLGFVAQGASIEFVGAFSYNAMRFLLGALVLIPLLIYRITKKEVTHELRDNIIHGLVAGFILWIGSSMQQHAIFFTTVGKAGFITGLYVLLVPLVGIFTGDRPTPKILMAALLSISGLYLLTVTGNFQIGYGDGVVLVSTLFWTAHIVYIGKKSDKYDAIVLSVLQFLVTSLLSFFVSLFIEQYDFKLIKEAAITIVYGGVGSVGLGFTLQVFGQRYAKPSHASVILSMETVFAALGAFLILGETMSVRSIAGCSLMLSGMILAQLKKQKK
jgi:drug/metabolite transporter (DMT)-like permease